MILCIVKFKYLISIFYILTFIIILLMTFVLQKLKSNTSSGSRVLILQSVNTPSSSSLENNIKCQSIKLECRRLNANFFKNKTESYTSTIVVNDIFLDKLPWLPDFMPHFICLSLYHFTNPGCLIRRLVTNTFQNTQILLVGFS